MKKIVYAVILDTLGAAFSLQAIHTDFASPEASAENPVCGCFGLVLPVSAGIFWLSIEKHRRGNI